MGETKKLVLQNMHENECSFITFAFGLATQKILFTFNNRQSLCIVSVKSHLMAGAGPLYLSLL